MANIFTSKNQPALFPMSVKLPTISNEDYLLFYKHERALFTTLLVILHREVVQSVLVVGFLLWLEREGYTSKNLVETIINSLTPDVIVRVVDEVVLCLKFLENKPNNFILEGSYDISMLQFFLDRKKIELEELHKNRESIFDEVSCMAKDVSCRAFEDILERFIKRDEPFLSNSQGDIIVGRGIGAHTYISPVVPFHSYDISNYNGFNQQIVDPEKEARQQALVFLENFLRRQNNSVMNGLNIVPLVVGDSEEELPPENRTIFLTFSKGYPITETEVREYFTRMFGDFIESIYMQPVEPENQPLFARIVARSSSMVRAVVDRDGGIGKSKYYINGKHVWARKYVKRTPSRENGEGVASPRS